MATDAVQGRSGGFDGSRKPGRLRRKLGDPDVIETIPGVGYRIT